MLTTVYIEATVLDDGPGGSGLTLTTQSTPFDIEVKDCIVSLNKSNFDDLGNISYIIGTGPMPVDITYDMLDNNSNDCYYDFHNIRLSKNSGDVACSLCSTNTDKFLEFHNDIGQIVIQADLGVAAETFINVRLKVEIYDNGNPTTGTLLTE